MRPSYLNPAVLYMYYMLWLTVRIMYVYQTLIVCYVFIMSTQDAGSKARRKDADVCQSIACSEELRLYVHLVFMFILFEEL